MQDCARRVDFICHSPASKLRLGFTCAMPILPLLLILAQSSTAPTSVLPTPAPRAGFAFRRGGGRLFISPMGEPFRPPSHDQSGLALWFAGADRNHDGRLTLDEMQADADRFFALLDLNHDGEIDPDEIERYETVVAPEISTGEHFAEAAAIAGGAEGGRGGYGAHGHRGGGGGGPHRSRYQRDASFDGHQGASRFGLLDLPEPVTAADADFNRGVSREEFRQAAGQRFLALDLDHHGFLMLPDLEKIRPAPAPEPNRDTTQDQPSDTSDTDSIPNSY
jgi:Ca2+-binding EF-hand superfamily protein